MIHDCFSWFKSSAGVQAKKKEKPCVFLTPHLTQETHSWPLAPAVDREPHEERVPISVFSHFSLGQQGSRSRALEDDTVPTSHPSEPTPFVRLSRESSDHYAANSLSSSPGMLVSNCGRPESRHECRDCCLLPTPAVK